MNHRVYSSVLTSAWVFIRTYYIKFKKKMWRRGNIFKLACGEVRKINVIKGNESGTCPFMMAENATCMVGVMGPDIRPALVSQTIMTVDYAVAAVPTPP